MASVRKSSSSPKDNVAPNNEEELHSNLLGEQTAVSEFVIPVEDTFKVRILSEADVAARAKKGKGTVPQISEPIEDVACAYTVDTFPEVVNNYTKYFPDGSEIILPSPSDRVTSPPEGCRAFYTAHFNSGLRLPLSPLFLEVLKTFSVCLTQLVPNSVAFVVCFSVLMIAKGFKPSFRNFTQLFRFNVSSSSNRGYFFASQKPSRAIFDSPVSSNPFWKSHFFFVRPPSHLHLADGSSIPFSWDHGSKWVYGGRVPTGEFIPDDAQFIGEIPAMRANKYQSALLIGETFLRKAGLSAHRFPISHSSESLGMHFNLEVRLHFLT
jgi:hypothetical protein